MTDAPERIWAVPERNCTVYMSGNSPITAQDGPFTHRLHGAALEYIRADLVEAMETENRRLRDALRQADDILEDRGFAIEIGARRVLRAALSSTGEKG